MAAVAGIMRDPVAHAAGAVWAAEDTVAADMGAVVVADLVAAVEVAAAVADSVAVAVVAVAAVVVVAAVAAAADGGDKNSMRKQHMKTTMNLMTSSKLSLIICAIVSLGFFLTNAIAAEQKQEAATATAPASGQKQFDTPKQAADALIQVATTLDLAAAREILGPDGEDLINSGDPVLDKSRATAFANKAKEKNAVELDKSNPNHAILIVGKDDFPLPIPIVKNGGKWSFDTKVGKEEILNRRVGENELNAIDVCRGYVEAQHEYAQEKHDDAKVNQYAQKILSTPGKHDGLAWQNADGTWGGPVGETVAKALEEGYKAESNSAYHGYYYKVLKGQGPDAPMGEMDFMIGGAMIGGFALAAAPAEYRVTGVQTFIVGPDGVVYQKDLGPDTLKTFQSMDRYNPDKTWQETDDDEEDAED